MSVSGVVFNIQKFSVNDGPGIRTVVFLKGCPLRCRWCANPESQSARVQILWDGEKCLRCGHCVSLCPHGALRTEDGAVRPVPENCAGCLRCVGECPGRALQAEGEQKTVEEVARVCMQDMPFYEESGGGVTLSGGEALMQPEFSIALLRALRERGVHTAVETTGYAAPEVFRAVAEQADLLLFDIKHWDGERHRQGTGVTNELPLANMKLAIRMGKDVLPRLPVIPGFNDSLEDVKGFALRLREVGASRVQLLPFHQFGQRKYEMLGRPYELSHVAQLHPEDLEDYRHAFLAEGIDAFF